MAHGYNYERSELRNGADEMLDLLKTIGNPDAFGRLRIAQPYTLFDSKLIFDNGPLFWDDKETSSGSPSTTTSTHSTATASVTLGVSAEAGTRVRQTFQRFNYQPGKSQLILQTGRLIASGGGVGIASRRGYFDDNNGLFWAVIDGTLCVVVRSSASGSPVDTVIRQTSFNRDKLDGTGLSGFEIDVTKEQITWIDFEWLGVGAVRFGIYGEDGKPIVAHVVENANTTTAVYMSTPNLPLRYELANDGTGQASTAEQICSTVISEGGLELNGAEFYASTSGTHVDANTADAIYAIVGIRLKTTHLGAVVELQNMSMMATTSNDFEWLLIFNPTVAGSFTYADITNSACQSATGATANTVTGGRRVSGGFVKSGQGTGNVAQALREAIRLGAAIDGTRDQIVLCARPLTLNADVEGSLTWRELL